MSSTTDPNKFKRQIGYGVEDAEDWISDYVSRIRRNTNEALLREVSADNMTPESLKASFDKTASKFDMERINKNLEELSSGDRDSNRSFSTFFSSVENERPLEKYEKDLQRKINLKTQVDPKTGDMLAITYDPVDDSYKYSAYKNSKSKFKSSSSTQIIKPIAELKMKPNGYVNYASAGMEGVKKKAMDRLVMEAAARDMTPHSNTLTGSGTKFVSRWMKKYKSGELDEVINKFAKTGKVTDKFWTALPIIGKALALAGIASAPYPAEAAVEAAIDSGIDLASGGILTPGELGKGTLPPQEVAKRKAHNAKIRLQKLKERQQLRQKRKSNEPTTSNLY